MRVDHCGILVGFEKQLKCQSIAWQVSTRYTRRSMVMKAVRIENEEKILSTEKSPVWTHFWPFSMLQGNFLARYREGCVALLQKGKIQFTNLSVTKIPSITGYLTIFQIFYLAMFGFGSKPQFDRDRFKMCCQNAIQRTTVVMFFCAIWMIRKLQISEPKLLVLKKIL